MSAAEPANPTRPPRLAGFARMSLSERAGVVALALITLIALFAPHLTPYDPQLRVGEPFLPPSWTHPFGTDDIGRDLFSRVIIGIRLTWLPGLAIIVAGLSVGTLVGLVAGAVGGWVDTGLQRLTELFLILPSTLIALAVVAALGPGLGNTMLAVALFWWPWYARIARTEIRAVAPPPPSQAARRARGAGPPGPFRDQDAAAGARPAPSARGRGSPASRARGSCSATCCRRRCPRCSSPRRSTSPMSSSCCRCSRSSASARRPRRRSLVR